MNWALKERFEIRLELKCAKWRCRLELLPSCRTLSFLTLFFFLFCAVSRSTLKRACREYKIHRWPPRNEHTLISHFRLNESSAVIDQKRIPQPSSGRTLLPSNQVSATNDTNRVTVMASYGKVRIKFRLSWPWRKVELEQQVKKRLPPLVAGTYYVKYKDEDDGLTLIACDEDLEDYISSSSLLGTHSIQVFLEPKVAHEFLVDQL